MCLPNKTGSYSSFSWQWVIFCSKKQCIIYWCGLKNVSQCSGLHTCSSMFPEWVLCHIEELPFQLQRRAALRHRPALFLLNTMNWMNWRQAVLSCLKSCRVVYCTSNYEKDLTFIVSLLSHRGQRLNQWDPVSQHICVCGKHFITSEMWC